MIFLSLRCPGVLNVMYQTSVHSGNTALHPLTIIVILFLRVQGWILAWQS